jgi:hypothetical protein
MKETVVNELVRQIRFQYNINLVLEATSALVILASIGLFYFGNLPIASVTSAAGTTGNLLYSIHAKKSKKELHTILEQISLSPPTKGD